MVSGRNDFWLVMAWIPGWGGGILGMIITAIVIVGLFLLRKRWWDAANFAIALAIVVAIGAPMAALIARVRPETSLAEQVATSFPSGHTAVATTVVITLGLLLRRWYVWTIGIVWVVWMFWSRTYLSAHWLSDVLAGLLEGIAVATLVWYAVEAVKDRRARKHQGVKDSDRVASQRAPAGEARRALLLERGEALAVVVGVAQRGLRGVLDRDRVPEPQPLVAEPADQRLAREERLGRAGCGALGGLERAVVQLVGRE